MVEKNPSVDGYLRKARTWGAGLEKLREILLECGLKEEIKWRTPCYTLQGANVAFIGEFKDHFLLSFLKGALLKDADGLLSKPGENTQSARVMKLRSVEEVDEKREVILAYIPRRRLQRRRRG